MDNEKKKKLAMTFEEGKTVSGDIVTRRPWHKPVIKRINIKRTMFGEASLSDGGLSTT